MRDNRKLLSNLIITLKYGRFLSNLGRRETWEELTQRCADMHIQRFPSLQEEIQSIFDQYVKPKYIAPAMRSMQFGGKPILRNNVSMYNCSYMPVNSIQFFNELTYLLLSGVGVGLSVQRHHIAQLPPVHKPLAESVETYVVGDSIKGWAEAVRVLIESYFIPNKPVIKFDYSEVRPKGAPLVTAGGTAPGPEPLRVGLEQVRRLLDRKGEGEKLTSVECLDLACYLADVVLSGGIRRAALITFFDKDDEEMLNVKSGDWMNENPQRGRSNNSVVLVRGEVTEDEFNRLWQRSWESGYGEPGVYWTNDKNILANPCVEASLREYTFCNLCEINAELISSQEELEERCRAIAFLATLQASYTDFKYLRSVWRQHTEEDALLGISITGVGSGTLKHLDLEKAAEIIKEENRRVAELIGINSAKRCTCIKPSGTASLVMGTSSGIHDYHAPYYIRRVRIMKSEPVYEFLMKSVPALMEDDAYDPTNVSVISVPIEAPKTAHYRELPIRFLNRVKRYQKEWVQAGHIEGINQHSISATVSVKEEEWEEVRQWMWKNRNMYAGLTVLPHFQEKYPQLPFEEITVWEYKRLVKFCESVDFSEMKEETDNTSLQTELACGGGACEIR